ncbi:hypothetical protein Gpo141_00009605 [Globisporangium polare]
MANTLLSLVLLLLLLYAAALAQTAPPSGRSEEEAERRRWAVDKFFDLQSSVDGERVQVELRHACGAPVNAAAESFCQEFQIAGAECARLAQILNTQAKVPPPVLSVGSERLGTVAVTVRHIGDLSESTSKQLRVAVHRGDLPRLDLRVSRLCQQFSLDYGGCSRLRQGLREKVLELEMQAARRRLVHAASAELRLEALITFEDAIRVLQQRNERLQQILDEKTLKLKQLQWESLATKHDSERRIRYEQYLQYAKSSTPVIFTGWSVPKWTLESLRATCGEADVVLKAQQHTRHNLNSRVGSSAWAGIQTVAKAKLSAFIDDLTNSFSNLTKPGWPKSYMDLYLHDMSIARFCPQLLADPLFKIPAFFTRDLLQQIDIKQNAYWPSLFVGGASTSSGLHSDWGSSAAWMMVLQGRKHWVIAKPSSRAALFECVPTLENPTEGRFDGDLMKDTSSSSENGNDGASCGDLPTSLLEPGEVFEDVLETGEVLFIPADCPHQVRNLDTTVTIAANFVDEGNARQLRSFLERKRMTTSHVEYEAYTKMVAQLDEALKGMDP